MEVQDVGWSIATLYTDMDSTDFNMEESEKLPGAEFGDAVIDVQIKAVWEDRVSRVLGKS